MRRIVLRGLFGIALCLWSAIGVLFGGVAVASGEGAVLNPLRGTIPLQWVDSFSRKLIQSKKRAPVRYVGAVMAILGTFNEAGVLPEESDPRANQLIRSLIQFQSVFMKGQEPAVHDYLSSALSMWWGEQSAMIRDKFYDQGWSSESLEALVEYSRKFSMWENRRLEEVFHMYNLSLVDWALIEKTFLKSRERFVSQNQDLHAVFARQRLGMPGGGR